MTSIVAATQGGATTVDELRSGALAARKARNSLRRLLAALAAAPPPETLKTGTLPPDARGVVGGVDHGDDIMVDTMRAKVQKDLQELRVHSALASLSPATQDSFCIAGASSIKPRPEAKPGTFFDLAPRMRLRLEAEVQVLAVAMSLPECDTCGSPGGVNSISNKGGCIAIILSTGFVEIWEHDPFCWHHASTSHVPLPPTPRVAAAFASDGRLLWVSVASGETSAPQMLLFVRAPLGDKIEFVAAAHCPLAVPVAAPVPLPNSEVALALHLSLRGSRVHVFKWHGGMGRTSEPAVDAVGATKAPDALIEVASFEVDWRQPRAAGHMAMKAPQVVGLWALPPACMDKPMTGRLAVWLRSHSGEADSTGELQVRDRMGTCLAVLPLELNTTCLAVPCQGNCPDELLRRLNVTAATDLSPFVLLTQRCVSADLTRTHSAPAEWSVAVAVMVDPSLSVASGVPSGTRLLQLRHLRKMPVPSMCTEVTAFSGGLLGFQTTAGACVLDWQQQRVHTLPVGWSPVAMGPFTVVILSGSELLFLEHC